MIFPCISAKGLPKHIIAFQHGIIATQKVNFATPAADHTNSYNTVLLNSVITKRVTSAIAPCHSRNYFQAHTLPISSYPMTMGNAFKLSPIIHVRIGWVIRGEQERILRELCNASFRTIINTCKAVIINKEVNSASGVYRYVILPVSEYAIRRTLSRGISHFPDVLKLFLIKRGLLLIFLNS